MYAWLSGDNDNDLVMMDKDIAAKSSAVVKLRHYQRKRRGGTVEQIPIEKVPIVPIPSSLFLPTTIKSEYDDKEVSFTSSLINNVYYCRYYLQIYYKIL